MHFWGLELRVTDIRVLRPLLQYSCMGGHKGDTIIKPDKTPVSVGFGVSSSRPTPSSHWARRLRCSTEESWVRHLGLRV